MEVVPSHIIGYRSVQSKGETFFGFNPETGKPLATAFREATESEIDESVELAQKAFPLYRKISAERRSVFLDTIATNIDLLGDDLLHVIHEETALPLARLSGERDRTTGQLKLFARLLRAGEWNGIIKDEALPERKPLSRPEIVQMQVPIGVVAIFGASNFPLAFSVAGGDTTAALAAGCPVVFKAHPAHPATCQLVGNAIMKAAKETGMPDGTFSMLHGFTHDTGSRLVTQRFVKAVAFTGSYRGGKALYDLAVRRKEPIPVYAEMGSVNPVFFLPGAVKQGGDSLARQFAQSVTLGAGQFCTNPGLCIFKHNEDSLSFIQQISNVLSSIALHPMLTRGIADAFQAGLQKQNKLPGAKSLMPVTGSVVEPHIIMVFAKDVLQNPDYFEEVFGPSTLAVLADTDEELNQLIGMMPGQLTATIHASEKDFLHVKDLAELLSQKAGRLVMNGFPTGVEVCHAMVHGGPFPATTDSRVTSVGTTSIYRFTRPVCYQNMPADLLPIANR